MSYKAMSRPIFSIILPTFNRKGTIAVAIESVIKQDHGGWELIIVDDGSTDSTRHVVEKYLEDSRISYLFQENRGVSAARNKGVQHSSTDYLIFLDSDDKLEPNLISTLLKNNPYNYEFLCWEVRRNIDGKHFIVKPQQLGPLYNNFVASFLAGSCCYQKEVFNSAGGFDPKISFGENYELGIRICEKKDLKVKVINVPLLYYSVNSATRTSNSFSNRLSSYIYQYKKHRKKYQQHPKEHAKMNYFLAYVLEKSNRRSVAYKFYKNSLKYNPWNLKAILKSLLLKVL